MEYLLDTDICIYLVPPQKFRGVFPNTRCIAFASPA